MNTENEPQSNQGINNPEQREGQGDVRVLLEEEVESEEQLKEAKKRIEVLEVELKEQEIKLKEAREKIEILEAELRKLEERAKKAELDSISDPLTNLKTRRYFIEEVEKNISAVSAPGLEKREEGFHHFSILFCDIDNFKGINDTYGHNFGDEILKKVGQIIEKNTRNNDTVCRWGGEEIVVSLPGADEQEAKGVAEKIRKEVQEETDQEYRDNPQYTNLKVSLSIGVSSYKEGLGLDLLVTQADKAMFLAKKEKNQVKTHSDVLEQEKTDSAKI